MTTQPNIEESILDESTALLDHVPAQRSAPERQGQPDRVPPARPTRTGTPRGLRYTLPGTWGALAFVCLSFTPSLLPRSWLVQALVCGISGSIGYGLGVSAASIWRAFVDRDPRPARRRSWWILCVAAAVALPVAAALGHTWQRQLRELMGLAPESSALVLLLPAVAAAVFVGILTVSRGLRAACVALSRLLDYWIGARAARVLGWGIVLATTVLVVNGVVLDGSTAAADRVFALRDTLNKQGAVRPTSPLRSGGPGSLVSWDSLGREGRAFVGTGPTAERISAVTGRPARDPIRIFAGRSSESDVETRAEVAVNDLVRAGGFSRRDLLVVTTTGSGWVDPASVDAFEYLTGGDSATIAMQYSYLPSWISYLVDKTAAREAGRELFDAVYERWSALPADRRPKLYVFGESLGSFGGETAFSGEHDLRNRTAGALFAGPPHFNTLYRSFTDERDPGSRAVQPVYKRGRTVRFGHDPRGGFPPASAPWRGTRVVYLVNPSDPIVWWDTHLLLHRPDWLTESRGNDVVPAMTWIPFVSFCQVTADLPFATGVPVGHGHTYSNEYVAAWRSILRPTGWSTQQDARLQAMVSSE